MQKTDTPRTVGLVGLGLVGTAISEHLISGGYRVIGFDIDPARCEALDKRGGVAVKSPVEVASHADQIFLSLMTTEVVCQVIEAENGLLEADRTPHLIIDTTTGTPPETIALGERLQTQGIEFLDAPISGSSQQIRDREALFLVGGSEHAYRACKPLLATITNKALYVGPTGSGAKVKLASNLILGLNRLALAEGLVFAEHIGLQLEPFLEILKQSPAYSVAMDVKGEKMIRGDFSPQAKVSQHSKDLKIILEYANKSDRTLPMAQLHQQILAGLIEQGDGDLDCSAVIKALRDKS